MSARRLSGPQVRALLVLQNGAVGERDGIAAAVTLSALYERDLVRSWWNGRRGFVYELTSFGRQVAGWAAAASDSEKGER